MCAFMHGRIIPSPTPCEWARGQGRLAIAVRGGSDEAGCRIRWRRGGNVVMVEIFTSVGRCAGGAGSPTEASSLPTQIPLGTEEVSFRPVWRRVDVNVMKRTVSSSSQNVAAWSSVRSSLVFCQVFSFVFPDHRVKSYLTRILFDPKMKDQVWYVVEGKQMERS